MASLTLKELSAILIDQEVGFEYWPSLGEIEVDIMGDEYIFMIRDGALYYIDADNVTYGTDDELWVRVNGGEQEIVRLIEEWVDAADVDDVY